MWGIGRAWGLARKVERLLELEAVHGLAIDGLKQGLASLEKRITRLETLEGAVANEAKAAARAGAQEVMHGQMMEIGRRIGQLEAGRQKRIEE